MERIMHKDIKYRQTRFKNNVNDSKGRKRYIAKHFDSRDSNLSIKKFGFEIFSFDAKLRK
jgi:hypothetical protein